MRLIDADALPEIKIHVESGYYPSETVAERIRGALIIARNNVKRAPTIDAEPVMHSYWIGWEFDGYADGFPVFDTWVCNECGEYFRSEGEPPAFNYCPNCGAKMDGDPHDSGR